MEFFRVFFMDLGIWGSFENGECIWGDINIADKQGRPGTLPLYARVCLFTGFLHLYILLVLYF